MTAQKVQVKLFATEGTDRSLESYIPVFHRWIREGKTAEMLIDVADYTHVPRGIGVLLVGHGADIAVDEGEGRPGLLFSRKRDLKADKELVADGLESAMLAAKELNEDAEATGPKGFSTAEILFRFPDRLSIQNDDASFSAVRPQVEAALKSLLPGVTYILTREGESREPLTIRARA